MEYDKDQNKENWITDKEKIPVRRERPLYGWHVVPARQSNQISTESMAMALDKFIRELVELNPAAVELVTQSPHERLNAGVMTNSAIHSVHGVTQAALLIERVTGWGERHQLSGSRGLHALPLPDSDAMKPARLPKEYIWIYAPRDVQELAVIKNILVAGVKYMTESKDIVVPQ